MLCTFRSLIYCLNNKFYLSICESNVKQYNSYQKVVGEVEGFQMEEEGCLMKEGGVVHSVLILVEVVQILFFEILYFKYLNLDSNKSNLILAFSNLPYFFISLLNILLEFREQLNKLFLFYPAVVAWWYSVCFIRSVTLLRWIESRLGTLYPLNE